MGDVAKVRKIGNEVMEFVVLGNNVGGLLCKWYAIEG